MILVMGTPSESIVEEVYECLKELGEEACLISPEDIPGTTSIVMELEGSSFEGFFRLQDSKRIYFSDIKSIFNRAGFTDFELYTEYTPEEISFVNAECTTMLFTLLNHIRCPVINRPIFSSSNASKPHQISLIRKFGFKVPETIITNDPLEVREFYESHERRAIYKSVSYVRSIVQRMNDEDLERLHSLKYAPLQVQELIEGTDVRVHVTGPSACFASIIRSGRSDYRYDKSANIEPYELPEEIAARCFALARGLGMILAGIDLRKTPGGEYYCFEVNPSPYFTWYEYRTHQPITRAVCSLLRNPEDIGEWSDWRSKIS